MARDGRVVQLVDGGPEALAAAVLGGGQRGLSPGQRAAGRPGDDDAGGSSSCCRPAPSGRPARGRAPTSRCRPSPVAPATRTSSRDGPVRRRPSGSTSVPFSAAEAAKTRDRDRGRDPPGARRARPATSGSSARSSSGSTGPVSSAGWRSGAVRHGRRPARGAGRDPIDGTCRAGPANGGRGPAARRIVGRRRRRPWRAPIRGGTATAIGAPPTHGGAVADHDRRRRRAGPVERLLALIRDELDPAHATAARGDRAGPLVARRSGRRRPPPRRRWPIASSGRCSASCRPPDRSPRPRSTSASPRCSPATTCPTRGSSGPASTATGAWPARPTGWSPPTTCCVAARSTRDLLATLADAGHRLGMRVWLARTRADPPDAAGPCSATASTIASARLPRGDRSAGRDLGEVDCDLVHPRQGRAAVRGRVDRDARRAAPAPARPDPAGRPLDPVPRHRPGADRARPLQARPLAAAARRASRSAAGTSSSRTTCARFLAAEQPDLDDLEPLLGLDPVVERSGEQMPLFGG